MLNFTVEYVCRLLNMGNTTNTFAEMRGSVCREDNFLTATLSDVEDKHKCLFHNGIYRRKKLKNQIKKQVDIVLPLSPKVGLSDKCFTHNVSDAIPRMRRLNRYIELTITAKKYRLMSFKKVILRNFQFEKQAPKLLSMSFQIPYTVKGI